MMSLKTESELLQKPTKQIHKGRQMKKLILRLSVYFAGLFVMTIGIALSVKSNLGVSPVSSIPYTMTRVFGIEMGNATIIFHCALVLIQLLILRKNFSLLVLLQIPVGIVFGKFTIVFAKLCFCCNWNFLLCSGEYCSASRRGLHGRNFKSHKN